MELWSSRFQSKLDECIHLVLALVVSGAYATQRLELVDSYGKDTIEQAYYTVVTDYKTLIERL